MLNSQKVEDELNLALDATQSERERSAGLETGYDPKARTWELIVKYSGDLEAARSIAEAVTELSAELCDPAGAGKPAGRDHFASAN